MVVRNSISKEKEKLMKMKTKRKLIVAALALILGFGISSAAIAGSYTDAVNALSPTHYYRRHMPRAPIDWNRFTV